MGSIDNIKAIIAKIDTNSDNTISNDELLKSTGKVPSLWLEKIKQLSQGADITTDKVISGLVIEQNPENRPVTAYNDKRPGYVQEDFYDNLETIPTQAEYIENFTNKGRYDIELPLDNPINPELDFSQDAWLLREMSFGENTFANTPKENLPEGYDPAKVFELGKNPGLNTRAVHEMGYTGRGVKVAICDWLLSPSENYDSNIVSYKAQENARTKRETMHGAAVTSILAGKETGVAPDAEVYYFAERGAMRDGDKNDDMIKTFQNILELNRNLPENEKIRVVSISGPIYGGEEAEALVKELNESGVWVMSSPEFWENFGYLDKKNPMGNPDDFDNYQVHVSAEDSGRQLYVNSGDRTVAHYTETADYRHDSKASASWAIPVVAGYYALACEADSSMTPESFMKLAEDTAQVKKSVKRLGSEDPQREYERHEGYIDCMYEFVKKDRPQISREEFTNLDDETWNKYSEKMFKNLDIHAFEDAVPIFVQRGKEILTQRGEYDENGKIKSIPASYLPSTEEVDIKIIDIKALIEKIEAEKS